MNVRFSIARLILVLVLAAVLTGVALVSVQAGSGTSTDQTKPCCFANDQYSGICKVFPTGDETCADILGYLNNPMATGKTYCGNTRIRSGWHTVACE